MSETIYPERYTLEMAAEVISEQTGEEEKDIQSQLIASVQEGKLPVYKPGSNEGSYFFTLRLLTIWIAILPL